MTTTPTDPPELHSRADVASLLGVSPRHLAWWIWALRPAKRYSRFELVKRSGGTRVVRAPARPLKEMQRTLAGILATCYDPPPTVHGFTHGRSPLSNARRHVDQEWLLKIDIEGFFPSINFGRVRGLFLAHPFNYGAEVATTLAQLCCFENELPQGAPTSPIVSNLICRRLDRDLGRIAMAEHCFYTRYADDITFSTDRQTFPSNLATVLPNGTIAPATSIAKVIATEGFRINSDKTRLVRQTQRQRITGIVVNEFPNVPREYVRSLRAVLYIWERFGIDDAAAAFARAHPNVNWPPGKQAPEFRRVIRGRVQYVGSVKGWAHPVYRTLAARLQARDPGYNPRTLRTLHSREAVNIYCEGATDLQHLKAAEAHFHANGDFLNLDLQLVAESDAGGDRQLLKTCEGLRLTRQAVPCICVFDRDNASILSSAVGSSDFKDHGNRVAAIAIIAPPFRSGDVCIECLYEDADLARVDAAGRRLYLAEEFDSRSGHHKTEPVTHPNVKHTSLVKEEVYRMPGAVSVGLSKSDFATYIEGAIPPYDMVSFEGFRPTFELLEQALARIV